jgi:hypothetical protein
MTTLARRLTDGRETHGGSVPDSMPSPGSASWAQWRPGMPGDAGSRSRSHLRCHRLERVMVGRVTMLYCAEDVIARTDPQRPCIEIRCPANRLRVRGAVMLTASRYITIEHGKTCHDKYKYRRGRKAPALPGIRTPQQTTAAPGADRPGYRGAQIRRCHFAAHGMPQALPDAYSISRPPIF